MEVLKKYIGKQLFIVTERVIERLMAIVIDERVIERNIEAACRFREETLRFVFWEFIFPHHKLLFPLVWK